MVTIIWGEHSMVGPLVPQQLLLDIMVAAVQFLLQDLPTDGFNELNYVELHITS